MGLVPLALWVHALPPSAEGRRSAVRGGMVFGAVHFGILFHWMLTALVRFSGWAVPGFLGVMLLLVVLSAFLGWGLHRAVHGAGAPLWVALPVLWTAAEWFRGSWPGSLALPWLGLGTSLTGFPELVGVAELVGARGVGFWLALVNGVGATLLLNRARGRHAGRSGVALAVVVLVPAGWGLWRASNLEVRAAGRVAVVQPGIPQHVKMDRAAALDSTLASLERLLSGVEPGTVDLVVFPEMTFHVSPRQEEWGRVASRVQDFARDAGAPVLFGALGLVREGDAGEAQFNSAFLMRPEGLTAYQYDKRHLVPGVERIPGSAGGSRWAPEGYGGFGVGDGWPLAEAEGIRAGVLICYESAFQEAARRFRLEGADLLVNITNDAWFGGEPPWSRTSALWQHPAHMVMRAIENRVGVARAANTGVSLFIDPVGRVTGTTDLFRPEVSVQTVTTSDIATFYTRHGDLAGRGSALAALALLLGAGWVGRRRSLDPEGGHR